METVWFKTGEVVLSEGEDGDSAYLIVSGAVEVIIGEGARAKSVATLGDGDVFGEMSLIEPGPRSATVRAVADTECAVTSYEDFMEAMRDNPAQAMEFMKVLVLRLRKMNEMMACLDPARRSLMSVFREWVTPGPAAGEMSEEERELRLIAMMHAVPHC